ANPGTGSTARAAVEAAVGEVDALDRGVEVEFEIGMALDEARQTRHQPARRERGQGADAEHAVTPRAQRLQGGVDRVQVWADALQQQFAFGRRLEPAWPANEQRAAEAALEQPDLVAERADGQVQAFRRP